MPRDPFDTPVTTLKPRDWAAELGKISMDTPAWARSVRNQAVVASPSQAFSRALIDARRLQVIQSAERRQAEAAAKAQDKQTQDLIDSGDFSSLLTPFDRVKPEGYDSLPYSQKRSLSKK